MSTEQNIVNGLANHGLVASQEFTEHVWLDFQVSGIGKSILERSLLRFHGLTFKQGLTIVNLKSNSLSLEFTDCTFSKGLTVKKTSLSSWKSSIKIDRCKSDHVQLRDNSESSVIEIIKSQVEVLFMADVSHENISILNCKIDKTITLLDVESKQVTISSIGTGEISNIIVSSPKLEYLEIIARTNPVKILKLQKLQEADLSGIFGTIDITSTDFKSIEIDSMGLREMTEVIPSQINELTIRELSFSGLLNVESTDIKSLNFLRLNSVNGGIRLTEVKVEDASFVDCTVANFYWNQLTFVNPPEIIRSDLSTLKMSNVQWPKNKRLRDSFLDEKIKPFYIWRKKWLAKKKMEYIDVEISDLRYQRDTYRQLKAASIANHNHIESLEFYKNEMILYWKEIRLVGGQAWYDRILVFLNRWVSNFGQAWHMPLIWLLVVHFILLMCLFSWKFSFQPSDIEQGMGEFFYMLNPVHKSPEYVSTGFGEVTEFFMRVTAGFFIYHFIKAIRKFGKV